MANQRNGAAIFPEKNSPRRPTIGDLLYSGPIDFHIHEDQEGIHSPRHNNASPPIHSSPTPSSNDSPYLPSPWNQASPPMISPWKQPSQGLIGSIVREEGHIYSLAASGDLLYTGSDSKNIRVWKNLKEFSGFKSSSGLVKAIVVAGGKIFTGHQDGKIRVWKFSGDDGKKGVYKRIGSLPTTTDYLRSSIRNRWIKHLDAVSSMSLDEEHGLLYSGSWDKTLKIWRIFDFKCLESVDAHDDAVNTVAVGFAGLVFTGSADGKVKVWRRELVGKSTQHVLLQVLMEQESAVTALAVNSAATAVYCGSSDGAVNFWEQGKHFLAHGGVIRGHKLAVLCLAVADNLVISGSVDKNICVWRREEGGGGASGHVCVCVLTGHGGPVKCLAVEEDGGREEEGKRRWLVYSGSLDKSVKVWRVSERPPELTQL